MPRKRSIRSQAGTSQTATPYAYISQAATPHAGTSQTETSQAVAEPHGDMPFSQLSQLSEQH